MASTQQQRCICVEWIWTCSRWRDMGAGICGCVARVGSSWSCSGWSLRKGLSRDPCQRGFLVARLCLRAPPPPPRRKTQRRRYSSRRLWCRLWRQTHKMAPVPRQYLEYLEHLARKNALMLQQGGAMIPFPVFFILVVLNIPFKQALGIFIFIFFLIPIYYSVVK